MPQVKKGLKIQKQHGAYMTDGFRKWSGSLFTQKEIWQESETCCLSEDTSFEILEHNKKHYCPCDFEPGVVLSPLYDWFHQFSAPLWGMCYSAILTVGEKNDT